MSNSSRAIREREARHALNLATIKLAEAQAAVEKLSAPVSPGRGTYQIDVQFERSGPLYTFLVLIDSRGAIYTTAVADGEKFPSFDSFVEWLRGKDAHIVTPLYQLEKLTSTGIELV